MLRHLNYNLHAIESQSDACNVVVRIFDEIRNIMNCEIGAKFLCYTKVISIAINNNSDVFYSHHLRENLQKTNSLNVSVNDKSLGVTEMSKNQEKHLACLISINEGNRLRPEAKAVSQSQQSSFVTSKRFVF